MRLVRAALGADLADRLEEGQRLDVADGAADFDQADVEAVGGLVDAALDLVGDVRDHLHGAAEVVAAALLADHVLVDPAGGDRVLAGQARADEALVVAEVEVGFGAVVGDVDLAVLERAHRARIDVDVGIELHHRDPEAAGLEDGRQGRGGNALAKRGHHATGYENETVMGNWGRWKAAFYRLDAPRPHRSACPRSRRLDPGPAPAPHPACLRRTAIRHRQHMSTRYNAADIEVLSGLDPVKRRPGMYTDTTRPNHLAQEVIDNSVDEALAGHAKTVEVTLLRRRQLRGHRRRPRHAGRHPSGGRNPRRRADPDPPARRRQVHQQELHVLRRPARRRRHRGQCAVEEGRSVHQARRQRIPHGVPRRRSAPRRWRSIGTVGKKQYRHARALLAGSEVFRHAQDSPSRRCATCCAPRPCSAPA